MNEPYHKNPEPRLIDWLELDELDALEEQFGEAVREQKKFDETWRYVADWYIDAVMVAAVFGATGYWLGSM